MDSNDMIKMNGYVSKKARMSMTQRAKIFLPFAALKGFEYEIAERQKVLIPKKELAEDRKYELDLTINILLGELEKDNHPVLQICYFEKDKYNQEGYYYTVKGMLSKIDMLSGVMYIVNEPVPLENIFDIKIEEFIKA